MSHLRYPWRRQATLLTLVALLLASTAAYAQDASKTVLVLVGMPGSGKSTAAKMIGEELGGVRHFKSGDVVRDRVRQLGQPLTPENDRNAAQWFADRPGRIGEGVVERVRAEKGAVVIVDGIRAEADLAKLREAFKVQVLSIDVPAKTRYARMKARGRFEGETVEYYKKRDARESKLGVRTLMKKADYTVRGEHSLSSLRAELKRAVRVLRVPARARPGKPTVRKKAPPRPRVRTH